MTMIPLKMVFLAGAVVLFCVALYLLLRNRQTDVFEDEEPDADIYAGKEKNAVKTESDSSIYAARSHLAKAEKLKREGDLVEAMSEMRVVQEIQATRDKVYFKSFKQLIRDNIYENKFRSAKKFLEKYENMLGVPTEKQFTLVSYVPLKELYEMKTEVAMGLHETKEALRYSLASDWFTFREQYERPINVFKFAYDEFNSYLKQLNGGIISKKYLPQVQKYLSQGTPSELSPETFINENRTQKLLQESGVPYSQEQIKDFVAASFFLPFDDFTVLLDLLVAGTDPETVMKETTGKQTGETGELREIMKYALKDVAYENLDAEKKVVNNNIALYKNKNGDFIDMNDIVAEVSTERGFPGVVLPPNFFPVLYFLLYWDVIYTEVPELQANSQTPEDKHPVDTLPGDFSEEGFYEKRFDYFTEREAELYEQSLVEVCRESIEKHKGVSCPVIDKSGWDAIDLDTIDNITTQFDKVKLINLLQLLANDFGLHDGLPGLYILPKNNTPGQFIVVKNINDEYDENELYWILNLHHNLQIPVKIVYMNPA